MERVPGVLVVWTGDAPVSRAFRIPPEGLILGRELLGETTDDRISREHARVSIAQDRFVVAERNSKNGTFVAGRQLAEQTVLDARHAVRTGRTVWVVFDDIRPFEGTEVTEHDGIVSGGRTAMLRNALGHAAKVGEHVVLAGEPGTGRGFLAHKYAAWRARPDDTVIVEDTTGMPQRELLAALRARPELRAVMTVNPFTKPMTPALDEFLRGAFARFLELPSLRDRPDELSRIVHDVIRSAAPNLRCHASLIEYCLLGSHQLGTLVNELAQTAKAVAARGEQLVRGNDVATLIHNEWVLVPDEWKRT